MFDSEHFRPYINKTTANECFVKLHAQFNLSDISLGGKAQILHFMHFKNYRYESSSNIGLLSLTSTGLPSGDLAFIFKFETGSRSCINERLEKFEKDNVAAANAVSDQLHVNVYGRAPAFNPDKENKLRDLFVKGYDKYYGTHKINDEAGGLELSFFKQNVPSLVLTIVGASITGAHSEKETLLLDTVAPAIKAILYVISNINQ